MRTRVDMFKIYRKLHVNFQRGAQRRLVSDVSYLSRKAFWDTYYTANQSKFEWLLGSSDTQDVISQILPARSFSLLDIGCGASTLATDVCYFAQKGIGQVSAVLFDISHGALEIQQKFHREIEKRYVKEMDKRKKGQPLNIEMDNIRFYYIQGDVKKMPFQAKTFDVVLDKGTTDSLLKDSQHGGAYAQELVCQVQYVLAPGGHYVQVTDEDPDLRLTFMQKHWHSGSVSYKAVDHGGHEYFIYIAKKTNV